MRRRFGRRGMRAGRMLARSIPPLLIRSNSLLSSGEFAGAADGLEQLARAAEARGGPRAARLYIEAGRARVRAAQGARGVELIRRGFGLLAASGRLHKLSRTGIRLVSELQESGYTEEAGQISDYLGTLSPGAEVPTPDAAPARRALLPTRCPACGAPVRSDEVEWLDEQTAECDYCGSPVRGDQG